MPIQEDSPEVPTTGPEVAKSGPEVAKSENSKGPRMGILQLYRYADCKDVVLLFIGALVAVGQGVAMPCVAIIFGDSMDASTGNASGKSYVEMMSSVLVKLGVVAIGICVSGFVWQSCFVLAAERQAARMRVDYFRQILTRDISWFDNNEPASLPSRMAIEVQTVQDAIGAKMGQCVVSGAQLVAGLAIAFVKGWELALVLCSIFPIMAACGVYVGKQVAALQSTKQTWFGRAGAVAEEVFAAMRVVAAFGGESRAVQHFEANLEQARRGGIVAGCHMGLAFGMMMACNGLLYALAFWYGAHHMIAEGRVNSATGELYQGSDIVIIFLAMVLGMLAFNDVSVPLMAVSQAMACAQDMRRVMDADSTIESCARTEEDLPAQVTHLESIEFMAVEFAYPSRPENKILRGLDLTIQRGQKVALVGESGSGKSTVIQLLERFYDPLAGRVLINGMDLKALPLTAWRRLVGYVGQEPVLFATSILENIQGGNPKFTTREVEAAAKQAQAMGFIEKLPQKLKTSVGRGGGQLSGGQKQRIAIARALVKRPQLLLLDEATSALDNESEKQVQAAIDALQGSATESLTTISVAHRLSTIRNSSVIFVVKAGKVVEKGAHDELMQAGGEYFALVQTQGDEESDSDSAESALDAEVDAMVTGESSVGRQDSLRSMKRNSSGKVNRRSSRRSRMRSLRKSSVRLLSAEEIERQRIDDLQKNKYAVPWGRLVKLAVPQWFLFPLALVGVLLSGAFMPLLGFLLSRSITGFYETCDGLPIWVTAQQVHECPDAMLEKIDSLCLYFVMVAAGVLVGEFCKYAFFTYIQENVVLRLRIQSFTALVRQDLGFFDDPANGPGGLTTTLARSTTLVAQMTGISFGNVAAAFVALIVGLSLAFVGSWKLSLSILAVVPCLCVAMALVFRTTMGGRAGSGDGSEKYSVSGDIASEAILNIRTVRALIAEQQCMQGFVSVIDRIAAKESKGVPGKGFAFGFGNSIIFVVYILGFGYGAVLADEGLEPNKMYQAVMCIMLSVAGAGFAATFTTDSAKAKLATYDVFATIDRESRVDAVDPEGSHKDLGDGSIEFRDICFHFPHRAEGRVLCGISFQVSAGQSVALVGPSGCGKSTVIQLLQRFYDPTSGSVLVGGMDLRSFDIAWWRQQIGFVGQEPVLFNMSLEENVRYGKPDATPEEVTAAAEKANMDYVLTGKVEWGDIVGTKGGKLSGGQKQRCAIARALLRDPKVLLLDEATSALDSTSERVVQAALVRAREKRTTFTIAHRLSTIQDSDLILVVSDGVVAESGTHDELMKLGGLYCNLETLGRQ